MPTLRDIKLKQQNQLGRKVDRGAFIRGVLCDAEGNTSGTGSVWADSDRRRAWYLAWGGGQPGQVRCVRLEPELGLGVLIGILEGSNEWEVLSDDPFLRNTGTTGGSYLAPNGRDFEPGGRLMMWLYSKAFVPLATYAGTGLTVNVVAGDYEDSTGARQSFTGALNFSIAASQPAGPNEHLLVGLYLDTAGALQSVDGATVGTGVDAPEPVWPAGAIRLAVVDLDDTQTIISLANDITDRRFYLPYPGSGAILKSFLDAKGDLITATANDTPALLSVGTNTTRLEADSTQATGLRWARKSNYTAVADPTPNDDSGDGYEVWSVWLNTATPAAFICLDATLTAAVWRKVGTLPGWPFDTITVGDTDANFTSLDVAISDAGTTAGKLLQVGDDLTEVVTVDKALRIAGISQSTVVTTNDAGGVTMAISELTALENLTVENTSTNDPGTNIAISLTGNAALSRLRRCTIHATGVGGATNVAVKSTVNTWLENCYLYAANATTNYALHVDVNAIIADGCIFEGDILVDAGCSLYLRNCVALGTITNNGTGYGWYLDGSGNLISFGSNLDLNGRADGLVLDADGDTTLSSPTDDQIDFEVSGADKMLLDASKLKVAAGVGLVSDSYAFVVLNTSGGAVVAGDVGYIDGAGEFKTTTTEYLVVPWAVVIVGGANNADIYVARQGRVLVNYTGAAPSDGDFLATSTSAGDALSRSTMHYAAFARCLAAGADGQVEALLLCNTQYVDMADAERIYAIVSHSNQDFVATINGAPSATSVVYNAPSSGAEDAIKPVTVGFSNFGYLRLHNTTRGNYRLIESVDTGTNTITTLSSTDDWADTDTITLRSQVIADTNTARYGDIDLSQQSIIPELARSIVMENDKKDTGTIGQFMAFHPMVAFDSNLQTGVFYTQVANAVLASPGTVRLIGQAFGWRSSASSTGTASDTVRLTGYRLAVP